jgi:protein-L-isoaspartate(D-aspartate) O-methyltransferase
MGIPPADAAWRARVDALVEDGTLKTPRIIEAFRRVPRDAFVPSVLKPAAAADSALPIGQGQTVSQPTTVAIMLEEVSPQLAEVVLDVGTGSGWQAALLSRIVGPEGFVYTIERIPALAEEARRRFHDYGLANVRAFVGDAARGLPAYAPYDVVISAAATADVPKKLVEQLAPHGRLLQPVTSMGLKILEKDATGNVTARERIGFVFVPFIESGEEPKRL